MVMRVETKAQLILSTLLCMVGCPCCPACALQFQPVLLNITSSDTLIYH